MSSTPPVFLDTVDFEDASYCDGEVQQHDALQYALQLILDLTEAEIDCQDAFHAANLAAIDSVLEEGVMGVEVLYMAREDRPVTSTAEARGSWSKEEPPEPCAMDTWLRGAIPELQRSLTSSYSLQQFLLASNGTKAQSRCLYIISSSRCLI